MKINKNRKEVVLDENIIAILKEKAKQEGRNLKNYMEFVLQENANAFEPSEDYKTMMDMMIDKHKNGKTNYTSWETIKKEMLK